MSQDGGTSMSPGNPNGLSVPACRGLSPTCPTEMTSDKSVPFFHWGVPLGPSASTAPRECREDGGHVPVPMPVPSGQHLGHCSPSPRDVGP